MRKLLVLGALMAVAASIAIASTAAADPGNGNGAVVLRDPYGSPWTCHVIDTHGHYWEFQCSIHIVTTPDGQVNEFLEGPLTLGDAPSKAVRDVTTAETGLPCDFAPPTDTLTTITQGVVTPGGQVKLTCRG